MTGFADFLDAKFELDERSLARDVQDACFASLASRTPLRCLDVGTGTGAMVRRVLDAANDTASIDIVALDRDASLLVRARGNLRAHLSRRGFVALDDADDTPEADVVNRADGARPADPTDRADDRDLHASPVHMHDRRRRIRVRFACSDIARFEPAPGERYDLVTAHAFMDLVPMRPLLEGFARWLAPGGLFYASMNYDGETTLLPVYADAAWEARLLLRYDASMEERRVDGAPIGGAHSGRRLHAMLPDAGFEILACASSDWNALPHRGCLRDRDALVVSVLLEAIRRENEAHCDARRLAAWWSDRRARLEAGSLGAIVHQIDLLAVRR